MKKIIGLIFSFLFVFQVSGQTFNFKNYNVNDDLPQNYIYTINQSSKGKLWIGTGEGLCTFDGEKFTNYTISNGLAENFVTSSLIDHEGNFWFGHYQGGVTYFDGTNFIKVNTKNLSQSPVNSLIEDSTGTIWVATQSDGILKITPDRVVSHVKVNLSDININHLELISPGQLMASTSDGLYIISTTSVNQPIVKILLPEVNIFQVVRDLNNQKYWIATADEGIYQYDPVKKELNKAHTEIDLENKSINLIYQDHSQHLWVSIYGEGLSKFAIIQDSLLRVGTYNNTTGLSNNYVKSFFIDRENNIWIGTYGGGLDQLLDPVFTLYTVNDRLPSNNVTALHTRGNVLWVGTEKGIVKFSFSVLEQNNLEEERVIINKNLPTSPITSINSLSNNELLLATASDGVWLYNYIKGTTRRWHHLPNDLLANKINHIAIGKDSTIWVATENGAYQYPRNSTRYQVFNMEKGLLHNNIHCIYIDKSGIVWFGTHGTGLSSFKDGNIINYKSPQDGGGIDVNCFEEDEKGDLWVGTYGQGIYLFDGKSFTRHITQKNGLGSNFCYQIIRDRKNNFWIGHKNGISKYDKEKEEFFFHQKKHGFLAEETNPNASLRDLNNNLWFGTSNGLLRYNPVADKPNVVGPVVNLYDLRLFFQKVDWSKYSDSLVTLFKIPQNLTLPYNKNHLTFEVRGISFNDPDQIRYKYKLEGFERSWSLETNENFVTYANMPPGRYRFLAVARNSKGLWSVHPASFEFEILNPFWKTWWFILLSVIVSISLVFVFIRMRTRSLIKRQIQLQEEKDRLLAEINEREKAQRLQKLTEEKLRQTNQELNTFIYRASHDLRGPLSTVKGLTNLGLMEIKDAGALKYFNHISDRIGRLDMILKDLIHIVEITEIELEIVEVNIDVVLNEVLNKLLESNDKIFDVRKNVRLTMPFYNDLKLIQIVLQNIIDNSIKYTNPEIRKPLIIIDAYEQKGGIFIKVTDDGIGIPEEIQGRIFDMFYRGTDQSKGSGLGLYLVNKIINKLNGSIKVSSQYMKGTSMEIFIPSFAKPEFREEDREAAEIKEKELEKFK